MNHFSSRDWFEFVRGVAAPALKERMQQHLEFECDQCQNVLRLWQSTLEVATRLRAYEPPEHLVESVMAAFQTERRWSPVGPFTKLARLVSDSFRQPSLAAVRSSAPVSQQLVYEAEPFIIDLRLQSEPGRQRVSLIGQILNANKPSRTIEGVEVVLLSGNHEIAKNTTNALGEFDFEFGDEQGLQLYITLRGRKALGIILPGRHEPDT